MKTRVDCLKIRDDFGIEHDVTCRCPNGDFKRKYIRGLIEQKVLLPTHGVVILLGELIDENRRLVKQIDDVRKELDSALDAIDAVSEITEMYYDGENPCY